MATLRFEVANLRAIIVNGRCATGHQAPFEVLRFANGEDPTLHPHNLQVPAIHNTSELAALTVPQLTAYLTGYGLPTAARSVTYYIACPVPALRDHCGSQ
ncbi:hypothetical protein C8R46DRAFT_1211927 [Mycena filopes]|nr:hypothetical protein C8R46DRAFT_1211927 [Mycena filopes]